MNIIPVLDFGYVKLLNLSGPVRRAYSELGPVDYDADDTDPAIAARMSFANTASRAREDDLRLAAYLMKHKHWSPFEMVQIWLEIKLPIFLARQFVRHRSASINEVSARYTKLPAEWYIPSLENITTKSPSNKQGRTNIQHPQALSYQTILDLTCRRAYEEYESFLKAGIAPELCRNFLHVNHFTVFLWRQDLRSLLHMLALRRAPDAQWEAQQYAQAIEQLLHLYLPETLRLFNSLEEI